MASAHLIWGMGEHSLFYDIMILTVLISWVKWEKVWKVLSKFPAYVFSPNRKCWGTTQRVNCFLVMALGPDKISDCCLFFCPLLVHPAVVIRQRKSYRRKDGVFLYFEDNAGVIVNNKGEMKGQKESTLFSRSSRLDGLTFGFMSTQAKDPLI